MRIGIDARLWNETGIGRYIRNIVRELQKLDKKNDYILFALSKDIPSITLSITNNKWATVRTDIRWHSLEEQFQLPEILDREKIDLMHFPYFSVPVRYTKPFIITLHDLIMHHFRTGKASTLNYPKFFMKHLGYRFVIRQSVNHARKILVPSEFVKEDLMHSLGVSERKIVVTKESYDLEIMRGKEITESIKILADNLEYFIYVGNFYPHKNVSFLINECKKLRMKEGRDIKLLLVGSKNIFAEKLQKNLHNGEHEWVQFLYGVSDPDLGYLYSKAIAFFSASKMEGFGLPALEAMALACPVVVSDIPAFREVCGKIAFYFDLTKEHSCARTLGKVISLSKSEREKIVSAGIEKAHEFSWKETAIKTLQAYEDSIRLRPS